MRTTKRIKLRAAVWSGIFILLLTMSTGCGRSHTEESTASDAGVATETESPAADDSDKAEDGRTENTPAPSQEPTPQPEEIASNELKARAVDGTRLVDSDGAPVQLRGISTHGLAWFPDYVNEDWFRQMKEEWGANVVRLAMYTAESGGYCTGGDQEKLKALIRDGVQYATDCGLYVIIDWHILSDSNPNTYIDESKAFFEEMSQEYADHDNVLYEICNEPNSGTSWKDVKSYAEQVIDVIRENDGDGVILVGTPNWCQYVDQAAEDPIEGRENVMYTLHFYASTHKESLRDAMVEAIEAGLPIFVSEYGICDASGNGAIDEYQADEWVRVMNENGVSYVAWSMSNKAETASIFKSSCAKTKNFSQEDLSDSGRWLYEMLTGADSGTAGAQGGSDGKTPARPSQEGTGQDTAPSQDKAPTQDAAPTQDKATVLTGSDGLDVSAQVISSWEQGDSTCYQYTLTVTNSTDRDCDNWTVQLSFDGDITLDSSWNGNYSVNGSVLTISSVDYNGAIAAGGSVGDIGFIVSGKKDLSISGAK